MARQSKLPITKRDLPAAQPFPYVDEWQREQASLNPKTAKTYITGVRAFGDFLQYTGKGIYSLHMEWPMPLTHITNADFFEFQAFYQDFRSESTAQTYVMGLLSYLKWLWMNEHIPAGIIVGDIDMRLKFQRKRRKSSAHTQSMAVTQNDTMRQQVPSIVAWWDGLQTPEQNDAYNRRLNILRDRAMIRVLFDTAMRISELASLTCKDIEAGWAPLIVGKGGRPRTVHIRREKTREAVLAYLNERDDAHEALFISHSRNSYGAGVSITTIHTAIKTAVKAAGLNKKLSAHDFRHYRATQLLRAGMPLEVLQEYLGHADVGTTRSVYAPVLGAKLVDDWLADVDTVEI